VAFLALLAERKINNLRIINTPLEFDSVPGHHLYHLKINSLQTRIKILYRRVGKVGFLVRSGGM
jgi:hypothetical protein